MLRLLLIPILSLIIPLCVTADDQPRRIRSSDLDKTGITAGPFKIRITRLNRGNFLGHGRASIEVEVENTSSGPETFYPQRLALVNRDNVQLNVWVGRHSYYGTIPPYDPRIPVTPLEIRITPGARIKEVYSLTGKVRLPSRLFYDDKLVAEIVE